MKSGIGLVVTSKASCWSLFDKRSLIQFFERLSQLVVRVHYDGPAPSNGFLDGFTGNQQKPAALFAGFDPNGIALVKKHE